MTANMESSQNEMWDYLVSRCGLTPARALEINPFYFERAVEKITQADHDAAARKLAKTMRLPDDLVGVPTSWWRRWWQRHVTRRR